MRAREQKVCIQYRLFVRRPLPLQVTAVQVARPIAFCWYGRVPPRSFFVA